MTSAFMIEAKTLQMRRSHSMSYGHLTTDTRLAPTKRHPRQSASAPLR